MKVGLHGRWLGGIGAFKGSLDQVGRPRISLNGFVKNKATGGRMEGFEVVDERGFG